MHALAAIVLASLAACFTDWLFMDRLIHRLYAATPALWRPGEGSTRIILSLSIGVQKGPPIGTQKGPL